MFALNKSPRFLLSHQEVLKGPTAFAPLEKRELLNVFSASANSRRLYWRVKQRVCFHSRPFARTSELIFRMPDSQCFLAPLDRNLLLAQV